jgi:hypothetical protein
MFCFCSGIGDHAGRQSMRKIDRQGAAVLAYGWFMALLATLT